MNLQILGWLKLEHRYQVYLQWVEGLFVGKIHVLILEKCEATSMTLNPYTKIQLNVNLKTPGAGTTSQISLKL